MTENSTPSDFMQAETIAVAPLSVTDKFIGIITEPAAVFDNIKQAGHRTSDWIIPLLVMTIIVAIGTYIKMSSPTMIEQMRQQTEERFDKMVAEGKMTPEQRDQGIEQMEKFGGLTAVFSVVGVLIFVPVVVFFIASIYWSVIKFGFKSTVTYGLLLSAYGLPLYFGAIDQLLTTLISLVTKNMFTSISPAIFMKPDIQSSTFKLMSAINPFTIWAMYVTGIGFSKVADISKEKAFGLVFGLWIAWTLLSAFIKLPFGAM